MLLHACAHNPTGVALTIEQWQQIRKLMCSKGLVPFFHSVFQGFSAYSLNFVTKPRWETLFGGERNSHLREESCLCLCVRLCNNNKLSYRTKRNNCSSMKRNRFLIVRMSLFLDL